MHARSAAKCRDHAKCQDHLDANFTDQRLSNQEYFNSYLKSAQIVFAMLQNDLVTHLRPGLLLRHSDCLRNVSANPLTDTRPAVTTHTGVYTHYHTRMFANLIVSTYGLLLIA